MAASSRALEEEVVDRAAEVRVLQDTMLLEARFKGAQLRGKSLDRKMGAGWD